MPVQIKLGNTTNIQTVGTVNAGTAIVPDANNSLFLADDSNRVAATSEFYSGPTQPLGNVKMWFDTTSGQLKVNDGKSWTVQKGHVQAKDHGSFNPAAQVYTGIVQQFMKLGSETTYDEITPTIRLTRGIDGPLYNAAVESGYDENTPTGTEWAFADINDNPSSISATDYANLNFSPFYEAVNGSASNTVFIPGVCHLIAEDIYFDVQIAAWLPCDDYPESALVILQRAAIPGSSTGSSIPTTINLTIVDTGVEASELYINDVLYTPGSHTIAPGLYTIRHAGVYPTDESYNQSVIQVLVGTESYTYKRSSYDRPEFAVRLNVPLSIDTTIEYGFGQD